MQSPSEITALVERLYREESGKLIAVLARIFGNANLELAEDVVQDAMLKAIKHWSDHHVPDNPQAWLYQVAKNKAINLLKREQRSVNASQDVLNLLQSKWALEPTIDFLFSEKEVRDDQLRMIFTCCHPSLSHDSQIALALKILCGFKVSEIAAAFLTTEENIKKRLTRAKQKIRETEIPFTIPAGEELAPRLSGTLETIYLTFNEGYHASSGNQLIRNDLVEQAIQLLRILIDHPSIKDKQLVHALLSLIQLNASRFEARLNKNGQIITLEEQDRTLWDREKIKEGLSNLQKSEPHQYTSKYHSLAVISAIHCSAPTFEATNWTGILTEYDRLRQIDRSPVVELNRTIALSKVKGAKKALEAIEQITELQDNYLFCAIRADIYMELNHYKEAIQWLEKAQQLALLESEKQLLEERIANCKKKVIG